jgi:hypothetical protein
MLWHMPREGATIEPAQRKSLLALLETLAPLDENFPPIDDLTPDSFSTLDPFGQNL